MDAKARRGASRGMVIGSVHTKPTVKAAGAGVVTNFDVVTVSGRKERSTVHHVTAFNDLAHVAATFCIGDKIYIEGDLRNLQGGFMELVADEIVDPTGERV